MFILEMLRLIIPVLGCNSEVNITDLYVHIQVFCFVFDILSGPSLEFHLCLT